MRAMDSDAIERDNAKDDDERQCDGGGQRGMTMRCGSGDVGEYKKRD